MSSLAQNNFPLSSQNHLKPANYYALNDPSLRSTWSHRAWVATGCITVFISLAKSIMGAADSRIRLEPILAGLAGYVLADLLSGVYHWAIDNYGSASPPNRRLSRAP